MLLRWRWRGDFDACETGLRAVEGSDMDRRQANLAGPPIRQAEALDSLKIIKAGAPLADSKPLLSRWYLSETIQADLGRNRRENVHGMARSHQRRSERLPRQGLHQGYE